ncbi:MAG: Heme d1 biosynthesis protein NirD / Heme d1 biosynthesis protein NirL [Pseudomonadota bacterium]|jgi:DNA-binding Lrp family transcriptional regulator
MLLDYRDWNIIEAIQKGLPLVTKPYAFIGAQIGLSESEVISRIEQLQKANIIKRFGIVVRHRQLGYRSNGMVVWDIPDDQVTEIGKKIKNFEFVTLCYRRPRKLPDWRYNLFCMIHGQDRENVKEKVALIIEQCRFQHLHYEILFSRRCFKQCGAMYIQRNMVALDAVNG